MDPIIRVKGLTKSYGENVVLRNMDFAVNSQEVVVVIGPSGSGKSTLLRCLNLLERPESGEVLVDGKNLLDPRVDLRAMRTEVGMVFQRFNLFPHLKVIDNITLAPVEVRKRPIEAARTKAMELLGKVGLADKADAYPGSLSGGQAQRVAIARALAMEPKIMLFDEPTSALDPEMVGEVGDRPCRLPPVEKIGRTTALRRTPFPDRVGTYHSRARGYSGRSYSRRMRSKSIRSSPVSIATPGSIGAGISSIA